MIPCQRVLFDLPDDVAYFNCAYTSPLLLNAQAAGQAAIKAKATPWTITPDHFFQNLEQNRRLFAQLIGSKADDITIIPAVSYGIALAAKNIPVSKGQNMVVLEDQFPSNIYAWRRVADEKGVEIKTILRPEGPDWTAAVLDAIDPNTAVAALPTCHWTDGTILDLVEIGKKCRDTGTALVVDGIQSIGAMPFSVEAIKPDFLIAAAHKWLLGPYSFGFCYVAPHWHHGTPIEENWLNRAGSQDFARLIDYRNAYQPGARRFDVGEASNFILAPIAASALEQILIWDVNEIADTLRIITNRLANRAKELGLQVSSEAYRVPHMIGLTVPGGLPETLLQDLAKEKVYVSLRGNAIRISPHLYNTEEEVERLLGALDKAVGRGP